MNFSDMHITAEEYFDILRRAWENSEYFDGWERKWHPEDIANNFEVVFDGVTQGIIAYSHIIGKNYKPAIYNSDKKTVEDMKEQQRQSKANADRVQVFGGTVPSGYRYPQTASSSYTNNNVFGDNV